MLFMETFIGIIAKEVVLPQSICLLICLFVSNDYAITTEWILGGRTERGPKGTHHILKG